MKGDVRVWQLTRAREREQSNEIFILAVTSGTVDLCCGDVQRNTKARSVCLCGNAVCLCVRARARARKMSLEISGVKVIH